MLYRKSALPVPPQLMPPPTGMLTLFCIRTSSSCCCFCAGVRNTCVSMNSTKRVA